MIYVRKWWVSEIWRFYQIPTRLVRPTRSDWKNNFAPSVTNHKGGPPEQNIKGRITKEEEIKRQWHVVEIIIADSRICANLDRGLRKLIRDGAIDVQVFPFRGRWWSRTFVVVEVWIETYFIPGANQMSSCVKMYVCLCLRIFGTLNFFEWHIITRFSHPFIWYYIFSIGRYLIKVWNFLWRSFQNSSQPDLPRELIMLPKTFNDLRSASTFS